MNNRTTTIAAAVLLAAASVTTGAAPVQWTAAAGGNDHRSEIVSVPTGQGSSRKGWNDALADARVRTAQGDLGRGNISLASDCLKLASFRGVEHGATTPPPGEVPWSGTPAPAALRVAGLRRLAITGTVA